jgi:hypothetical protein
MGSEREFCLMSVSTSTVIAPEKQSRPSAYSPFTPAKETME